MILGDLLDVSVRRALIRTDGDLTPFFTRPISLILVVITLLTILARVGWFRRLLATGSARLKSAFSRE